MLTILADAAFDASAITPAISAVGSLGFAIWFAWYTTVYTLPSMQKEHKDAIKELTETHAGTVKEFLTELRSGRESYERWKMGGQH